MREWAGKSYSSSGNHLLESLEVGPGALQSPGGRGKRGGIARRKGSKSSEVELTSSIHVADYRWETEVLECSVTLWGLPEERRGNENTVRVGRHLVSTYHVPALRIQGRDFPACMNLQLPLQLHCQESTSSPGSMGREEFHGKHCPSVSQVTGKNG